jgi:xanthine dehydrogenase accessory factor
VHTPAGLDLGARSPEEVALSILAEIVAERPRPTGRPVADDTQRRPGGDRPRVRHGRRHGRHLAASRPRGERYWFCGTGCLRAFAADPRQYV